MSPLSVPNFSPIQACIRVLWRIVRSVRNEEDEEEEEEMMVTPFKPDIVIHNTIASSLLLFELTCPLDSAHHLREARSRKQDKIEYHQILSELDRLDITNYYETLEISVLGNYHQYSVTNTYNALRFVDQDLSITKSSVRQLLDDASKVCIAESQRIFMVRDCREWLYPT